MSCGNSFSRRSKARREGRLCEAASSSNLTWMRAGRALAGVYCLLSVVESRLYPDTKSRRE